MEAVKSLNVGDAQNPSTKVGPVIDATAQKRIMEYIEKGKQEGTLAIQVTPPENGYFVPPTVFTDISADATIAQEEILTDLLIEYRTALEASFIKAGRHRVDLQDAFA